MAKKPVKKRPPPPPPPPPPILSSSSDEESPPPVKKLSAGSTATVLRKHPEPSLKPADGVQEEENEESSGSEEAEDGEESSEDSGKAAPKRSRRAERRVSGNTDDANNLKLQKPSAATKTLAKTVSMVEKSKEIDESSESEEKESTDDESSEDSMNATRQSNPLTQKRDSQTANDGKQDVSNTSSSSDSGSGDGEEVSKELNSREESKQPLDPSPQPVRNSANPIADPSLKPPNFSKSVDGEEEDEDLESEEEEESKDDESSEDIHMTALISSQPRDSQNMDDDKQASNASSSSGSGLGNDEEDIETPISDPSLKPLSNIPIDSSAQPVDKEPNSGKQSTASHARISKKKRTVGIVGAEGAQEKERFKRIWSNEDEMALLQGILEYKERHHVVPYAHVHAVSLLKSVKDSLSISVSVNQINDKVRRMKKRYNNTATRKNLAKKSKFSDPHNAAVFYLSKKIWDSVKEESIFLENEITLEKNEEKLKKRKKESKHFAAEYPSLYWLLRSEHSNNALVLQNHIPIANAKKLDEKCKELEMIDIQLNMQKIEFLSSAVKLIKDALAKC